MAKVSRYELAPDKKGAIWDVSLYVPMIVVLISIALKLWYGGTYQTYSYILLFAASYIFFIGFNRIFSTRLMMMSSSPQWMEIEKSSVTIEAKGGDKIALVKELRYFPDYAGKSFGLSGMDLSGKKHQFVFHRGQFVEEPVFKDLRSLLSVYK